MIGLLPQVQTSYVSQATDIQSIVKGQTGLLSFDVLADVNEYFNDNDSQTVGWILKKVAEKEPGNALFWSSRSHPAGTVVAPQLFVEFQTTSHTPPPPPTPKEPCPDDEWDWDQ